MVNGVWSWGGEGGRENRMKEEINLLLQEDPVAHIREVAFVGAGKSTLHNIIEKRKNVPYTS